MPLHSVNSPQATPPATAVTYQADKIIGGLMTFSIPAGGGRLDYIKVVSKDIQTVNINVFIFDANPTATTWTNDSTAAVAAADVPKQRAAFVLSSPSNKLGTQTIWTKESLNLEFAVPTIYVIMTPVAAMGAGTADAFEVKLGIVQDLGAIPVNTVLPTITGTAKVEEVLDSSPGTWTNTSEEMNGTTYTYQWKRGGTNILNATARTYVPVDADIGTTLTVSVVAKTPTGSSPQVTSAATGTVSTVVPLNSELPSISGTAEVGQTLTAADGTWTRSPTSFAYQWKRDDTAIGGATASTYVLVTADINSTITVSVTANNAAGSSHPGTSQPTPIIIDTANQGTSVATFGAVGDGVTDDTGALQSAADSDQPLWFPKTANFYKTARVVILKNTALSNGAEIRLLQDGTSTTSIFRVVGNEAPLTIDGLVLNGLYTTGSNDNEFSAGIELLSAANVTLSNLTIKNTVGDNIYLAFGGNSNVPCRNITISNNTLSNPYRSNITMEHTDGVTIKNNTISKAFDFSVAVSLKPKQDGVSNNIDVTLEGNNITCVHNCIAVSPNQTTPFTGLQVLNNIVFALANFFTGVCHAPSFKGNQFTATNYPSDVANARMFIFLAHSRNIVLDGNFDLTVPGVAVLYLSLELRGNSTKALDTNNKFVLIQPVCPAIPWAFLAQNTDCGLTTQAVTETQDLLSVIDTLCPATRDLGTVI